MLLAAAKALTLCRIARLCPNVKRHVRWPHKHAQGLDLNRRLHKI